jgi:hypothetical protein
MKYTSVLYETDGKIFKTAKAVAKYLGVTRDTIVNRMRAAGGSENILEKHDGVIPPPKYNIKNTFELKLIIAYD